MIQNLLHTPSRTSETNASGTIKDGAGKGSEKEKEGLFKQLFESLQNSEEKAELSNKPKDEVKKEGAEAGESITVKSEESKISAKNDQTASTQTSDDDTVKQNTADEKIADLEGSVSLKDETILKTGSKSLAEQQDNRTGSESGESKPTNVEGQISQGAGSDNGRSGNAPKAEQQGENIQVGVASTESNEQDMSKSVENSNHQTDSALLNDQVSDKSDAGNMASSPKAQGIGETISADAELAESGKSEAGNMANTPQPESQGATTSTETGSAEASRLSESANIASEKMNVPSPGFSEQMKTQPESEKQAANASQFRSNSDPVSVAQGFESVKADVNTLSASEQATKMPSELDATPVKSTQVLGNNMLQENESGTRIDTLQRDTGNITARMVMGQSPGGVLAAGPNGHPSQAADFVRNAQVFVAGNGQLTEASREAAPSMLREELLNGNVNKPEVFGISSDIKNVFAQKSKSQDTRARLDVDNISMRADSGKRSPVLDMENLQFGSNGHQATKWDWASGIQNSSSDITDEPFTFKKFTPENTVLKESETADQKSINYTNLASVTISNISVKRNVLPGLSQVILSSGTGKSSPESWNKHSFVLEDGSKIQLSSRKLDGVIQLKIGSTSPELNRLLQQHQNEIIEHLKKESKLDVDLQFDNPQEDSGFESFDDRKRASQSSQMQHANGNNMPSAGPREYASGRNIRTFGYNNMEWTA